MAKILKIQTGTVDVVVTQEFDDEDTAMAGTEVNKTDVKIAERSKVLAKTKSI